MQKLSDGTVIDMHGVKNGSPLVLIHGLGLCREVWQWQLPALSQKHLVITYDLYGHGDSDGPPEEPTLGLFSRQLDRVLETCDIDRAAIIGFSLGGMIARRYAQDHPEKVAALAILHSPHKRTAGAQDAILKRVEQARIEGPAATVEAALERWFTDGFRRANAPTMDLVRRWVLASDIAVYHRNYRVLADGIDEIVAPVPPITAPTLVVTGDEDFGNGPEITAAIAREIEGAETQVLKGLRHMALAEDPEAINDILLRFLERHLRT